MHGFWNYGMRVSFGKEMVFSLCGGSRKRRLVNIMARVYGVTKFVSAAAAQGGIDRHSLRRNNELRHLVGGLKNTGLERRVGGRGGL
ncbi:hypothetical protein LIER_39538 [Lithospermum erythrorhizon]|uniref:Uncharacterized protein n=1 Tax=Lithospermum erythrorhizon TaxID=34254 RepID=A0AAV3QLX7_LITER